ncbi:MAG: M48 family metalloprotease [Magnetococcales bacterium]|nr:M48 family metalloprotease [Magnetococcales bacterium]
MIIRPRQLRVGDGWAWIALWLWVVLQGCSGVVVEIEDAPRHNRKTPSTSSRTVSAAAPSEIRDLFGEKAFNDIKSVQNRIEQVAGIHVELSILRDWSPNAFAWVDDNRLKIGINYGMVRFLRGHSGQMAFVIGHEIAHHKLSHNAVRQDRRESADKLGLVGVLLNFTGVPLGDALVYLGGFTLERTYSREEEMDADRLSLTYLQDAGFSPYDAVLFHEKLARLPEKYRSLPFLSTHPSGQERVAQLKTLLSQAGLPTEPNSATEPDVPIVIEELFR